MKKNPFSSDLLLLLGILCGVFCGILYGVIFDEKATHVAFLGTLFLNALKMMIVPVVVASMVTGITNLKAIGQLKRTGVSTLLYFFLSTSIAVIIGLLLVNWIQPGANTALLLPESIPEKVEGKSDFSILQTLMGMIPSNLFQAMLELDVLSLIVVSIFVGLVLNTMDEKGQILVDFFQALNELSIKMVNIIIWFTPLGVFGLIAGRIGQAGGWSAFYPELLKLLYYVLTVCLALAIHGFIVLPLIFWGLTKKNPWAYLKNIASALLTAFSTASSTGTLPMTIEQSEKNNQISSEMAGFVLPLGATVNMNGTALYEAVAALFIAQHIGLNLSPGQQIIVFLTATLAAIGAAGIPEAGLITMVLVLNAVGLPLEGIGLLLTVDWFLDRCRTSINVWSDCVGVGIIEHYYQEGDRHENH